MLLQKMRKIITLRSAHAIAFVVGSLNLVACGVVDAAGETKVGAMANGGICAEKSNRCVGPGEEYDTSGVTHVETVIQRAIDDARPGDSIKLRGGVYRHQITSKSTFFLKVAVNGEAGAPITIEPFEGESVHLVGFGFADDTYNPKRKDERLIDVTGDYIHIHNLELSRSSRLGLVINGNYGVYENLIVHNCWSTNIVVRAEDASVEGNVISNVESYRSRHGSGIGLASVSNPPQIIRGNRVEYSLVHDNGHMPDGSISPKAAGDAYGGGNSDGMGSFKTCHDDRKFYGLKNLCPNNTFLGNIAWNNADDGFDVSFAQGSWLIDNISFNNGPKGNKGFKVFSRVQGGLNFVGNIAMSQPSFGFEVQVDDAGLFYHNTSVQNQGTAMSVRAFHPEPGKTRLVNSLGAYSPGGLREGTGFKQQTNHWDNKQGDPKLVNPEFNAAAVDISSVESATVAEKREAIRAQFLRALAPAKGSPLIDAGTLIAGFHCERADDAAKNPMPGNADCRHWNGAAPDIGAVEYRSSSSQ